MNAAPIRLRRWTRSEYYRLDELGIFHPAERLELVGGQIVVKERQSPAHATAIRLAREVFETAFGPDWAVRTRSPITLDEESEPEPDIAIFRRAFHCHQTSEAAREGTLGSSSLTALPPRYRDRLPGVWVPGVLIPPFPEPTGLAEDALREAFGAGWTVRVNSPIALDDDSEPEPDIAVVAGARRDHWRSHPSRPVLIVEVADSTPAFDRGEKASLYARAWIADYWTRLDYCRRRVGYMP